MSTQLQTNIELREWQKKFNPSQPVKTITPSTKRLSNDKNSSKYLQQSFFSRLIRGGGYSP